MRDDQEILIFEVESGIEPGHDLLREGIGQVEERRIPMKLIL